MVPKTAKSAEKKLGPSPAAVAAAAIQKQTKMKPLQASFSGEPYVPSGSCIIDDLIGGSLARDGKSSVCPGYPRRRITEVFGLESSGKTTAALQAIAEVQRQGGWAMFLDFEHALHHGYASNLGVSFDADKLLLYAPICMEEGFQLIFLGIMTGADLIVVDSIASMVPKSELEKGLEDVATIGAQARLMSSNLPKFVSWLNSENAAKHNPQGTALLFVNQVRSDIKMGFKGGGNSGPSTKTSGGNALKFYATLRLSFTRTGSETVKIKDKFTGKDVTRPFGNHTLVKVVKNKLDAKQGHTSSIFIRYGIGIDDVYSIIQAGILYKVIKKDSTWYSYEGERFQGREALRTALLTTPKIFDAIRKEVLRLIRLSTQVVAAEEEEFDELALSYKAEFGSEDDDEGSTAVLEEEMTELLEGANAS